MKADRIIKIVKFCLFILLLTFFVFCVYRVEDYGFGPSESSAMAISYGLLGSTSLFWVVKLVSRYFLDDLEK